METKSAKTMRPVSYAELLVSSTDRYADIFDRFTKPTTSANWRLNLKNSAIYGYFTRLVISQIQFQWNVPTIVQGKNDLFVMTQTAGGEQQIVVELTPGFYNGPSLATEIQTAFLAAGGDASFTCEFVEGKFQMSVTGPGTIALQPLPPDVAEGTQNNRFLATIGAISENFDLAETIITGIAPLLYTRWVDMCSSYLTKYQRAKDNTSDPSAFISNVIARVYAVPPNVAIPQTSYIYTGTEGEVTELTAFQGPWTMTIDYNTPKMIKWSPQETVANFDLQLRDEYGDYLYWSEAFNSEYQFTMLCSED